MPSRAADNDASDLDTTMRSAGTLGDTAGSAQLASPPHKRLTISHDYAAMMTSRLAKPLARPEYLQTPGPYTIRYNPSSRKIPFVFQSTERFPPPPPVPSDSLDCNRAQCEPRSKDVVFTKEQRFLLPPSATKDVSQYDIESGVQMCEERSKSTLLPPHGEAMSARSSRRVASPPPEVAVSMPMGFNTAAIVGGRISKSGVRDVNDFLVKRSASPGPVYSPSYSGVESASFAARFSTQSRMPPDTTGVEEGNQSSSTTKTSASSKCRCLGEYPDCDNGVRNFAVLSTWENAPVAAMGKPVVPYVNPNKQQAPPPPEDDSAPMRRTRRPLSAARQLAGSVVIQHSNGEADTADADQDGGVSLWPIAEEAPTAVSAQEQRIPTYRFNQPRPSSAPLASKTRPSSGGSVAARLPSSQLSSSQLPWTSPLYVARVLESPFHASRVEAPAPVHVQTIALEAAPANTTEGATASLATSKHVRPTSAKHHWLREHQRSSSPHRGATSCPHPWMAANDYMQADVAAKVASDVVALCGNPRRIKFGPSGNVAGGGARGASLTPAKRQVAGGWGWASTWQRGAKAS